jgi:thermitase
MVNQGRYVVGAKTLVILAGMFFLFFTARSWGDDLATPFVEDELLIQHKVGVPESIIDRMLSEQGAVTDDEIPQIRLRKIKVTAEALEKVKAALARNPHVKYVENNFLAESSYIPNDSNFGSQWHLMKIMAPQGWDISTGSSGVPIAIIDSGIDPNHPDLAGKLLPGYSFLLNSTNTSDVLGHGTAVAGTAAAMSNNLFGVAGLAWNNPLMPLVVLDSSDYASYYNIAQAITYAADSGVRVMNISIGGSSSSSTLQNAVNYAWNKGAVIFASAMNNSTSTPYYPAACTNVVAVSATTSSDTLASFSDFGNWIKLSAPGASILTTTRGGGYGYWQGTSFASPLAAGLAALVLSINPDLSNAQVVQLIENNADDLGTSGFDPYFGYGRINAYKTLLTATSTVPDSDTTPPSVAIVSPSSGAAISGPATVNVSATDNAEVSYVQLYINGTLYGTDNTGPYSFLWDTAEYVNGSYDLVADAYDSAGNVGISSHVAVSVNNTVLVSSIPPTVKITSPANGSTVGKKVAIRAEASGNAGISRIELWVDSSLKKSVTSGSTLSWTWNTMRESKGAHTIVAKAYDALGNTATSSITVLK